MVDNYITYTTNIIIVLWAILLIAFFGGLLAELIFG